MKPLGAQHEQSWPMDLRVPLTTVAGYRPPPRGDPPTQLFAGALPQEHAGVLDDLQVPHDLEVAETNTLRKSRRDVRPRRRPSQSA